MRVRSDGVVYRKRDEWLSIVSSFKSSSLSRKAFCEQAVISISSLQRYLSSEKKSESVLNRFVELSSSEPSSGDVGEFAVELELSSGIVLRIRG